MTSARGSVYASCPLALVQAASARGLDGDALARQVGIEPGLLRSPGERIPMSRYFELYRLLEQRCDDPDLGLGVGHITFYMGMNLHLYMSSICRDLREYLNVIPSTIRLRGDQGRVLIRPAGHRIRLEWHPLHDEAPGWRTPVDEMLSSSATIINTICARPVPVRAAELSYARPADTTALQAAFGPELSFGCEVSCIYFDREALHYPLIKPGFSLGREFTAGPQSLFSERGADDPFLYELRLALRRSLPGGEVTVDRVAQALGVSRRTLQRRLEQRDSSFKQLLQSQREELSLHYLDDPRLAITEIALLLGYSDQASFSNAFRGWRGCSPSEYRRRSG